MNLGKDFFKWFQLIILIYEAILKIFGDEHIVAQAKKKGFLDESNGSSRSIKV